MLLLFQLEMETINHFQEFKLAILDQSMDTTAKTMDI